MCNPFAIKSMGFWDYLISDQPCTTALRPETSELYPILIAIILVIICLYLTIRWLHPSKDTL